jgi:outer membrane protein, heavy metal efflux system
MKLIPFLSLLTIAAHAAEVKLTTEGAVSRALKSNPALAAARFRIEEARGRLDAAGRRPNPELEFEYSQNVRMPERGVGVAWMQKFPRTARLALEKAVSRAELAAAAAEVRDAERRLAGEVRAAAVGLLALEKERGLRAQQILVSEELAAFLTKRVQAGEASAVDASQVELEAKQLATQVLMLDVEKATLVGTLRPLLGIRAGDTLDITSSLGEPGGLPANSTSVTGRGDYRAALANAEAAKQGVELARANKWEDISAGLMVSHERAEDAPDGFERDTMLGFKFSLPLPLFNKNEGQIREAAAAAKRAEKEIEAVAVQARGEAAAARAEMAALAKIVAEFDAKLIPAAKQIEDQLRANYAAGLTPLPEVIRARGKRFELEAERLDALRDYHLARVKHQTATGGAK